MHVIYKRAIQANLSLDVLYAGITYAANALASHASEPGLQLQFREKLSHIANASAR